MNKKPLYLSKTVWTNLVLIILIPYMPDHIKALLKSPESLSYLFGTVNLVLRAITKDELTMW